jgi:hypothetical protein
MANAINRRAALRSLVAMAGAAIAVVVATVAEARVKATKAKAQYQDHPKNGQRCGGCKFFIFPSSCSVVKGEVAFDGWCKLYER